MSTSWLGFRSYRKEREDREHMFSNLQSAYARLQNRSQILEDQEKKLATLNRISGMVSQSLELSQILDRAVDCILDVTGADGTWIYLLSEKDHELILSAHRGICERYTRLNVGYGVSGKVAETGRPTIINEVASSGAPQDGGQKLHSVLALPLRSKGQLNGVLGINFSAHRDFLPTDVELLSAVADQIAVAIDNARLYKSQQETAWGLRASEQRYRQLFESAHDAIWVHDLQGNLLAVNRATEELTGYTAEKLLTMNVKTFLTEESLNLARRIRDRLLVAENIEQPYEQQLIRRDGSRGFLKLTTNILRQEGEPMGFLHVARDVTEEKLMQDRLNIAYRELSESHQRLKESQEQLIQAEKLTSLGQLAASIAHEVNNPLSGVLLYDQLLLKKVRTDSITKESVLDYLSKMEVELIRSTKLVRSLLDFARQSPPSFRQVNLNEVINRAYELLAHSAQLQHVEVTKELDTALPSVMADFDQLHQVCTNLILNAIQAMPSGGKMLLRTAAVGGELTVEVTDTGCGISPENMSRLFTPFFTTKREVKGVGLGLAVSFGIVQRHKGRIDVRSKVGQGTTMVIRLPLDARSRGRCPNAGSAR